MKLKNEYVEYIESVCKRKTIKELKKIVKYLDDGDSLAVARLEKSKKVLEKKKKVIEGIEGIFFMYPKIKKVDLEKRIMETYDISRSTFYKYLKEVKK